MPEEHQADTTARCLQTTIIYCMFSGRWHDSRLFSFATSVTHYVQGQLVTSRASEIAIYLRTYLHMSFYHTSINCLHVCSTSIFCFVVENKDILLQKTMLKTCKRVQMCYTVSSHTQLHRVYSVWPYLQKDKLTLQHVLTTSLDTCA